MNVFLAIVPKVKGKTQEARGPLKPPYCERLRPFHGKLGRGLLRGRSAVSTSQGNPTTFATRPPRRPSSILYSTAQKSSAFDGQGR